MDFVNNSSPQQAPQTQVPQQNHNKPVVKSKKLAGKTMRILNVIVLVLGALIVGLLALYIAVGGGKSENKYVDNTKFQAVFLNGGQVYFGKIRSLNNKFITVDNIYYLRVNQQVQPNQTTTANSTAANQDVSLAKLGCELHGPTDVMVINREQVLFWENLKTDGQVSKAIAEYVKANPKGQDCTTAAGTGTSATPAATTPATKK
jgi:hypothetical protein